VSASHQSSFTPGRQPPPYHSLHTQTDLRAGLGVVNEKSRSTSVIKTWCPNQLSHNLVNILTQLTQPLFFKNYNMESRAHGHPYFLMVYTDKHSHTLTQINTWLEKTNCTVTVPTGMITPKTRCTYKAVGTFSVRNVLIYKCHSLQNSTVLTYNSKNENHKIYKIYLNI
jgi:hypothetical protein